MSKVAVITGASSGIGLCTAEALVAKGCVVYNISRRDFVHPHIKHISADVSDYVAVDCAVNRIIEDEDRIDILINCAGYGISGAVEYTDPSEAAKLLDVNFIGTVNMVRSVLPHMRSIASGTIINISSVAALIPIPFQTFYSASKAAINSYSMALANEVHPFGVNVCAILPGDTQTNFTASRVKLHAGDDIYGGRIGRSISTMEQDELSGLSASFIGKYIANISLKKYVKPLYVPGFKYKLFVLISRLVPYRFLNFVVRLLYAS